MLLVKVWEEKQLQLRALATSVVRDPSRAEDIVQEAFARVLKSGREFSSQSEAFRYLRTAVLTTAIDAYRRIRRHRLTFPKWIEPSSRINPPARGDPLSRLLRQQRGKENDRVTEQVRSAVRRLPRPQREAIRIFFGSRDANLKEVCREAGVPYSTLRSRMLKGIDQIRTTLRQQGVQGFNDTEDPDEL